MENVAQALKSAAAVLLFTLSLAISINSFGQARQTAQIAFEQLDRDFYDDTYLENSEEIQRKVGIETIVPSIYRAYKENYKIVFDTSKIPSDKGLYQKKNEQGISVPVFSIDLEKEVLGSDNQKLEFINAILYGPVPGSDTKAKFLTNLGITLNDEGICDIIKKGNSIFVEKLGIYYQEDIYGESNSPDVNKTKKRVITYADN